MVARGCRCRRAEPPTSNPQLKINEAETISAAVIYAPRDSLDAVTPGGPKRPGRSVVRSGRASPGHTTGTRRVSSDRAADALRVGKGGPAPVEKHGSRWCTGVVGVAEVSSDVLRVELSTGSTELGGTVCAPSPASQYRFGLRIGLATCSLVFRCEEMVDPPPAPIPEM